MSYERLYAGETTEFSGTAERPTDADPTVYEAIPKADMASAVLNAYDAATGSAVNGRTNQDLLVLPESTTGVTIGDTNGVVRLRTFPADANLLDVTRGGEEHVFETVITTDSTPAKVKRIVHRIHCASFLGLTSLDEITLHLQGVKDDDGIISDDRRFFIELMIDAVTARMERECDRTFLKPATAAPELCSPYEQRWIGLKRWPVTAAEITSVKESSTGEFDDADEIAATDYGITPEGLLIHRTRNWLSGTGTVQVTHKGGLARYVGAIPADLRMAATKQVATWWQRRKDLGVSGSSVQGASVTLFFKGGLVDELKDLIPHLKRRNVVL